MTSWGRRAKPAAVVAGLAGALFAVSAVVAGPQEQPERSSSAPAPVDASNGPNAVSALQARLERLPKDWRAWSALGNAYISEAVATADPSYYAKAEQAFARSLELHPEDNDAALTGQAALATSRHDFVEALELAEAAKRVNPYNSAAYGVLVDALIELGRYEEAEVQLQRMLDLKPSVASLTRASYFRELHGDIKGARLALEQARAFASAPSDTLFTIRFLGKLAFAHGDVESALRHYDEGLRLSPDDPFLLAARAEALAADGQEEAALKDYERSVQRLPDPVHLADYAALLEDVGKREEAAEQHSIVRAAYRLLEDAGSTVDLELALYEARLGNGKEAVQAARREYDRRQTIHTEDALAYALYVDGQYEEALPHAVAAERLSDTNGGFAYHRGLIEAALEMPEAKATLERAVRINPHSRDGKAAAAALKELS